MKTRVLDLVLLIAILTGGFLAWRTAQERRRLSEMYAGLVRTTGEFPIIDASKVQVQTTRTDNPMHFTWRVHFPPNSTLRLRDSHALEASLSTTNASEFLARVVFRENQQGPLEVYTHFLNGSFRSTFGDQALARRLHSRWGTFRVKQLGSPDRVVLDPKQPAVLLQLTLPDDLQAEVRKELPQLQKDVVPVLYQLDLGPEVLKP